MSKEYFCDNCGNEECCCIIKKQESIDELALKIYPKEMQSIMEGFFDANYDTREAFKKGYKMKSELSNVKNDCLQKIINQFGENGELSNKDWSVSDFLEWLQLNKFKIIKDSGR
jgi:hypothetical protein